MKANKQAGEKGVYNGLLLVLAAATAVPELPGLPELPPRIACEAQDTAGFDDHPGTPEVFIASVFFENRFDLVLNQVLMSHLAESSGVDAYFTLESQEEPLELSCTRVRGMGGRPGLSCTDSPPGQLLLLDLESLRFTRSSIGAWTFSTPEAAIGGSLFVEYGRCTLAGG